MINYFRLLLNGTTMLCFADKKIPTPAYEKLKSFAEVLLLESRGITYESISGHPDIFLCQINDELVVAPNLPETYKIMLKENNIMYIEGELPVGKKHPDTAHYNAVCTVNTLIHNFRFTDSKITNLADDLDLIHVNQGYTRCNLVPLAENKYITSDQGIFRTLKRYNADIFFIDPKEILLPGQKHGFIGGCCGIYENNIFFIGNLNKLSEGDKLKDFILCSGLDIIKLYEGPLFDGGSLLFLNKLP